MRKSLVLCSVLGIGLLLSLLPAPVLADEGSNAFVAEVNGYQIHLSFSDAVVVGENDFHLEITDAAGSKVSNAIVDMSLVSEDSESHGAVEPQSSHDDGMAAMDMSTAPADANAAMAGMDSMADTANSGATLEGEPALVAISVDKTSGEFSGKVNFPQTGHNTLIVHIMTQTDMFQAEFPIEVGSKGRASYYILAGFLLVILAIIGTAALTKKRATLAVQGGEQ
jgi:hypothetical protein